MKRGAARSGRDPLGLNSPITRRDFLNAALIGSGAALMGSAGPTLLRGEEPAWSAADWDGPGGVGQYQVAHGNPWNVVNTAHGVRDGKYRDGAAVVETGETFDCVIVGGGLSGLASALFVSRDRLGSRTRRCLILENHPIFGGAARRNEFDVDGQRLMAPQGPVQFPIPFPDGLMDRFYREVGFNYWEFQYQTWSGPGPEIPLGHTVYAAAAVKPKTFGLFFDGKRGDRSGGWLRDPIGTELRDAPISSETRADLLKLWRKSAITGEPPRQPLKYRGDEFSRRLDSMTLEDFLVTEKGVSRDTIRKYFSPDLAGGVGLGADVVSAFSQYAWLPAKDFTVESGLQQAAGGLSSLARHILKTLIPDAIPGERSLREVCRHDIDFSALDRPANDVRIRLNAMVIAAEHEGDTPSKANHVNVTYVVGDRMFRLKARSVVMAGGGWVTKHVVRDLPAELRAAYDQFNYGAFLRANVAVRNWRFLRKLGLAGGSWFAGFGTGTSVVSAVTYGADSTTIGPDAPTVLTIDHPFISPGQPIQAQCTKGRTDLLATPFRDYERQIRETLAEKFGATGFDARRDIAGIVLNRWGHALLAPQPGFFFGVDGHAAPRDLLRAKPFGRIAFAHTDLGGASSHVFAIREAQRAASQILGLVYSG